MAVPQRKVTHSRKAKRGSHLSLSVPTLVACKRCGKKIMPHRVCNSCGYYKGKKVLQIEAQLTNKGCEQFHNLYSSFIL